MGQAVTNAEAWFNIALRPRKPECSLGRTAQDGHLDSHTAPELWHMSTFSPVRFYVLKRYGNTVRTISKQYTSSGNSEINSNYTFIIYNLLIVDNGAHCRLYNMVAAQRDIEGIQRLCISAFLKVPE